MTRYILDTHTYLWFISNDRKLSAKARKLIEADSRIYVSISSLWEITIKASLGKITLTASLENILKKQIAENDFEILHIDPNHLMKLFTLPYNHGDPFDRIIIAQALYENLPIIGCDSLFTSYGVSLLF